MAWLASFVARLRREPSSEASLLFEPPSFFGFGEWILSRKSVRKSLISPLSASFATSFTPISLRVVGEIVGAPLMRSDASKDTIS